MVEESQDLPEKEEVMAENDGKDAAGEQREWRWTPDEKDEAVAWISRPVPRSRFLRARQWNVDAAMAMIEPCVRWRRTFQGIGVEHIDEKTIDNELKTYVARA